MSSKITLKLFAGVLLLSVLLASCAFDRNALIGTWQSSNGVVVTFTDTGKLRQSPPQGFGPLSENEFQFLNDTTILIVGSQTPYTYKVTGNQLTLDAGNNQPVTLTRVK